MLLTADLGLAHQHISIFNHCLDSLFTLLLRLKANKSVNGELSFPGK